jgi:asparagine synthase (glutamine-hydrolysing)
MLGRNRSGVVVLADNESARQAAEDLHPWGTIIARYPSGCPWVVGNCPDRPVLTTSGINGAAVVIGYTAITPEQLNRHIASGIGGHAWHELVDRPAGACHVLLRIDDEVRIRCPDYGLSRIFVGNYQGSAIFSDTIHALRPLCGSRVDVAALSNHLLESVPHSLAEQPLLPGIDPIPLAHEVLLKPDGTFRTRRLRDLGSSGELGLDEGAILVRDRLSAAVSAVTAAGGVVSSDLSGGYDSTSISCLAAAGPARVELVTAESRDPTSEDLRWALQAASVLPHCSHHRLPADDLPLMYAGLGEGPLWLDEPSAVAAARDRVVAILKLASETGSRIHLTGHGGDHLFISTPTHFHDMMRSNTRIAIRQLRGFAHLCGWSTWALLHALADRRDYRSWWTAHTEPRSDMVDIRMPLLGWAIPPTLPSWVAAEAAATIAGNLQQMADRSTPLSCRRGEHAELATILDGIRMVRTISRMATGAGLPIAAPYFDDQVIDACLAVRPEHRVTAWEYKPLLRRAMTNIVPDNVFARQTKDDGSTDVDYGLRRHSDELVALWEDSRLERLGLVDADRLRKLCAQPSSLELENGALYSTIGCELWLRDLELDFVNP